MTQQLHPTAKKLMDTVSAMLDSSNPHGILVDDVLKISGVARSSLYHHFGDFSGLIRATLLQRFSANVATDGQAMMEVANSAKSKDEYWTRIKELSAYTQLPSRAPIRAERARIMSTASADEEFAVALAEEQQRVTDAMAEAIAIAQAKGFVNAQLSPQAIAVFLQAYSLGRAIDDISVKHVPNEDWIALVETVINSLQSD
ncbi:TetR/AcrR family transcriptional regulator [Aurantimicrobium minutum]|uniref:TetR family transcriptional regulator n=1 Tax=Aurantimicrobium minutum TaxID=708131 RepID=A0A173LXS9_9MICO|nr:TetR/AcrR family transcriptional regulator [Aurantimicrobium minutum]BAU99786.1 TetR family transcriptional regulator [Aurantimicrobium minutum]